MPGTLFVVATPIGNLEDFTFRGLRTLREATVIAAEDTRRTSKLLAHYGIQTPMVSLHEHNEAREAPRLVARLVAGDSVALVSDAGTPGISDPGALLVREARQAGVPVVPVPGPSAVTAALSISGLVGEDGFTFAGFPPSSGPSRADWFKRLVEEDRPVVFFESPHRISRTIADAMSYFGERQIFVFRELTKEFEESVECNKRGHMPDNQSSPLTERGEFVLVVGRPTSSVAAQFNVALAEDMIGRITESLNIDSDSGLIAVSSILGTKPASLRKAIKKARIEARKAQDLGS